MDKIDQIKALVEKLNQAAKAYYSTDQEIMTNFEYDALYEKLEVLEKETGIVLSNSPTQRVGYEVLSELGKVKHASPMLSLDKTKDRDALRSWLNFHQGVLSWKLDGLTIVLTYNDGKLIQAVTRGNGEIGEDITNNAKVFENIPLTIQDKHPLTIRGEAVISYENFEKINAAIELESEKYKNPRNLCSGSVRQLNNQITKERHVHFIAFSLVEGNDDFNHSKSQEYAYLKHLGFDVVEHYLVNEKNILDRIEYFYTHIENNPYPSDGLVLTYEDTNYGKSLGRTSKFPRDSIAFKWQDEIKETTIKEVEWSCSRTGLINPVAIFEPVELEGTTVTRASLHNVSIVKSLKIGIGDTVEVYKANMIIPQIERNLTKSGNLEIPEYCPVCHEPTHLKNDQGIETLYCPNPSCPAKKLKQFVLFVSRDALNIDGLSEMTLEKFIGLGYLHELTDLFKLDQYQLRIENLDGFGKKSYANLMQAIEKAKTTTPQRLFYGLGIPNFGLSNVKLVCKFYHQSIEAMMNATYQELVSIDGIGSIMAESFITYINQPQHRKLINDLQKILTITQEEGTEEAVFEGYTFCITGSLTQFTNRKELQTQLENLGAKVTGTVTSKTSFLINNDTQSTSSKNKKAMSLGIPIIDEATIIQWISQKQINA